MLVYSDFDHFQYETEFRNAIPMTNEDKRKVFKIEDSQTITDFVYFFLFNH